MLVHGTYLGVALNNAAIRAVQLIEDIPVLRLLPLGKETFLDEQAGRLIEPLPTLAQARARAAQAIANLPPALRQLEVAEPWPVIQSRELKALIGQTRSNLGA